MLTFFAIIRLLLLFKFEETRFLNIQIRLVVDEEFHVLLVILDVILDIILDIYYIRRYIR